MWLLVIVLVALVALGVVAGLADWFRKRSLCRQLKSGEIVSQPTARVVDKECCGQHEVCEKDSLLAAVSREVEYYDDEELDRYCGRDGGGYSEHEVEEFRDVLYTMRNEDVAGWVRSLQLRGVCLPDVLKDEVFMIIGERRMSGGVDKGAGEVSNVVSLDKDGGVSGGAAFVRMLVLMFFLTTIASCSTKKNTGVTRFYHRFTAHYNTTFNGEQAFLEGIEAQENGHRDDYTRLLPVHVSANKTTAGMGKAGYDKAIEKAEKAIKKHSIKAKPVRKGNQRLTVKEKAYRSRLEFNTYLKRPWMLLAESQFRKGEFIEAASTYGYIIRLYRDQPDVVGVARARLAGCYVELDWPYDAEELLRKMARDSMTVRGGREREKSLAGYYILTGQYGDAVPYLSKAVKYERRRRQRSRLNYLLGQVAQLAGDRDAAYKAWQRVIRSSPPYELAFNARLRQAEVLGATNRAKILKKLRRMSRNEKNKDYQDQIYHAIGNVYLDASDTARAISAMRTGVDKATQNGNSKVALMLHLGQLYWETERYVDAADMYVQCVSSMDKKHEHYDETMRRNDILKDLAPPLREVSLQDSLLALSEMSEKDRNEAIDRVIETLKKKEKEEAKRLSAQEGGHASAASAASSKRPDSAGQVQGGGRITRPGEKGAWYFYNPQAVATGKQAFVRQWGNRILEDNWRRSDKQQVNLGSSDDVDYDDELAEEEARRAEEEARVADSLANDPHNREYYLRQIPFGDDAKMTAHATIANGLFDAGMIEITPLENYALAERTLTRLKRDYRDFERMPDVYYHLFMLYGRQGQTDMAVACRDTLIARWPDHPYSRLLQNPRYERNVRYGKHIEDSLYAAAYACYRAARYDEVDTLFVIHTEDFPDGPHRGRFLFVRAMSALYDGRRDTFFVTMKRLTEKYSTEDISAWAQDIVQGVQEGRLLNSDGMDIGNLWSRRSSDISTDSLAADTLSTDLYTGFVFVLAFPAHSLDENQLLYEVARYNFSTFLARNFDIEMVQEGEIHQLLVHGFNSYDEVHAYVQDLYGNAHIRDRLGGIRTLLISEDNLKRLGRRYSYDDYDDFYQVHFTPQDVPDDLRIDEPDMEIVDPENVDPTEHNPNDKETDDVTDDFEWPW